MAKLGSLIVELSTNTARFVQGINTTNRKLDQFAKRSQQVARLAAGAFGIISVGGLAKSLVEVVDKYKLMEGRLKLVQREGESLAKTQEKLFNLSQRTRGDVEGTVNFYVQLARATRTLNLSQDTLLKTTESINKAIIISGASAQSANAALFQLQQGLAAGALRGQELNSVLEQTPRVAEAIADGMGVTIGQLRKLGEEGKLTAQAVIDAISKQADTLDKEFSQVPVTVSQNMQLLTNEFERAAKSAGGFNKVINASIESLTFWVQAYNKAFNPTVSQEAEKLRDRVREINDELSGKTRGRIAPGRVKALEEERNIIFAQLDLINKRIDAENILDILSKARAAQARPAEVDPKAQKAAYNEWLAQAENFRDVRIRFEYEQTQLIKEAQQEAYDEWLTQDEMFRDARVNHAIIEADKLKEIEEAKGRVILNSTASLFGSLASIVGSGSKKQFELSKKLARAETIIATYAAAQQAYYGVLKATGGNVAAAGIAAAAAVAQGLARVTAINRTSFDSASSAASSSGAGSFVPAPSPEPITPGTNAAQGQTFIIISDGSISESQMDDILDRASQRINEGSQVIIRRDSVQAQELAAAVA